MYHVREYDVHKLMQVEEPIDIFLSHDWPVGITDYGKWEELVRRKPYFEKEVILGVLKQCLYHMCFMDLIELASSCLIFEVSSLQSC